MNRLRTALAVMLAGSLLGLGACSDEPLPKMAAPESTSPAASPSPSGSPTDPVAPKMPAAARKDTDAGAKAFVRYWVSMVNFAQATGQSSALAALNHEECSACSALVIAVDEAYESGGHIEGGQWSIGRIRRLPPDYGADWGSYARGRIAPQTVVHEGGARDEHSSGGRMQLYAYATWEDEQWVMRWLGIPS